MEEELERAYVVDYIPEDSYLFTAEYGKDEVTDEPIIDVYRALNNSIEHYSAYYDSFKNMLHYEVLFPEAIEKKIF